MVIGVRGFGSQLLLYVYRISVLHHEKNSEDDWWQGIICSVNELNITAFYTEKMIKITNYRLWILPPLREDKFQVWGKKRI